jgi:hypothetical protein
MKSGSKRRDITENTVAIRVRLYRKLSPTDGKDVLYSLLDSLPEAVLCNVAPWDDPDLQSFWPTPALLAVAAAIKWTVGGHITVVSPSPKTDWHPALLDYARERNVRVIGLSTYQFRDPLIFERFAIDTEVPAKGQWDPLHPHFLCQCRPVPGFDDTTAP